MKLYMVSGQNASTHPLRSSGVETLLTGSGIRAEQRETAFWGFFWLFICGTSTPEVCLNLQLKSDTKKKICFCCGSSLNECFFFSFHQPVFKIPWLSLYGLQFSASCHHLQLLHTAFCIKTELPSNAIFTMHVYRKIRYFFIHSLKKMRP